MWVCATAGAIFIGVALRDWSYRWGHPHALAPSAEIIALAVAGALVAFSVSGLAAELREKEGRRGSG